MIRRFIIAGALLSSSPAMASPSYLSCKVDSQPAYELQVTADEKNSAVSLFVVTTGLSQQLPAAFSIADLRFGDRMITYRIDRSTLVFERTIRMLQQTDRGKCTVQQPPKRAF